MQGTTSEQTRLHVALYRAPTATSCGEWQARATADTLLVSHGGQHKKCGHLWINYWPWASGRFHALVRGSLIDHHETQVQQDQVHWLLVDVTESRALTTDRHCVALLFQSLLHKIG